MAIRWNSKVFFVGAAFSLSLLGACAANTDAGNSGVLRADLDLSSLTAEERAQAVSECLDLTPPDMAPTGGAAVATLALGDESDDVDGEVDESGDDMDDDSDESDDVDGEVDESGDDMDDDSDESGDDMDDDSDEADDDDDGDKIAKICHELLKDHDDDMDDDSDESGDDMDDDSDESGDDMDDDSDESSDGTDDDSDMTEEDSL